MASAMETLAVSSVVSGFTLFIAGETNEDGEKAESSIGTSICFLLFFINVLFL